MGAIYALWLARIPKLQVVISTFHLLINRNMEVNVERYQYFFRKSVVAGCYVVFSTSWQKNPRLIIIFALSSGLIRTYCLEVNDEK